MAKCGRPAKIGTEQHDILRVIVADQPTAPLSDIGAELKRRVGSGACVEMDRAHRVERSAPEGDGYSEVYRRWKPEQRYPSCLTDTDWALVEDLFERAGGQGQAREGAPPRPSGRLRLRRPHGLRLAQAARELPLWHNVYKTFRCWSAPGPSSICNIGCASFWVRERREAAPSAAVSTRNLDAAPCKAARAGLRPAHT